MSEQPGSAPTPPPLGIPPDRQGEGCLTGLMVLAGLVMMFPAACVVLVFGQQLRPNDWTSPLGLTFIGAAVAGIALVVLAVRRWR
jgi:hypothetical protein